jgi:hypothetical protein
MGGTLFVKIYRADCPSELADLLNCGLFRPIPSSMQSKWFAESPADAAQWGQSISQIGGGPFHLVQIDIPDDVASQMFRLSSLDQIGPARYAEGDLLDQINQTHGGIVEVPFTVGGP